MGKNEGSITVGDKDTDDGMGLTHNGLWSTEGNVKIGTIVKPSNTILLSPSWADDPITATIRLRDWISAPRVNLFTETPITGESYTPHNDNHAANTGFADGSARTISRGVLFSDTTLWDRHQ